MAENYSYRYFSTVSERRVDWLWYPYIPYGKITVLQGDPGEGKSTLYDQSCCGNLLRQSGAIREARKWEV